MSDTLLIWAIGLGLTGLAMAPWLIARRRAERRTLARQEEARTAGLHEPMSLHPVIDPDRCIVTGACATVCPEEVIGIHDGRALAIAPAACVGHGLCERACPMGAISLVYGTASRGVELPRVREDFETNVPGLYIVGELGGMGLIRNAFEQGRQCMDVVARRSGDAPPGALDVLIVGCGPAGLASSLHALRHDLRFETLEKDEIGGTVRHFPRRKLVMTEPLRIPGYGTLPFREVEKERLVEVWADVVERTGLRVRSGATVAAVRPHEDGGFLVRSTVGEHRAARVVLAIGRRGIPRRLGVPGEESAMVSYGLAEPEAFAGDRILVVGGGDSAVEAALALAGQPGTTVMVSYRGEQLSRVKPRNRERFETAVARGAVRPLWSTNVTAIEPGRVALRGPSDAIGTVEADRVLVLIGGELPTRFLRECGVEIDTWFGAPPR